MKPLTIEEIAAQVDSELESSPIDTTPAVNTNTSTLPLAETEITPTAPNLSSMGADLSTSNIQKPSIEDIASQVDSEYQSSTPQIDQQVPSLQSNNQNVINTARSALGSQDYNGYCQTFVGDVTGNATWGTSALDAWQNSQDRAVQGLDGIKEGDLVYFVGNSPDAPGGTYENGHTGIYTGNGQFVSATNNGVQENDLGQWINDNNQSILGYIPMNKSN